MCQSGAGFLPSAEETVEISLLRASAYSLLHLSCAQRQRQIFGRSVEAATIHTTNLRLQTLQEPSKSAQHGPTTRFTINPTVNTTINAANMQAGPANYKGRSRICVQEYV